ncbi:PLP-dependent transferase [Irpex rosettiformis]|uniref:PLP-dependent transferase n=1 Tax=Irpex rosettiformis TaxID=378272 RepID=A0ACB8U9G9_9APHY|nr:PLP-dependent transferase [Irpex rosettiformis]
MTESKVQALPVEFYTRFFSELATSRKPSPIRSLFPLERTPGLISLLAGKPNPTTFPLTSIKLTSRSPTNPGEEIVTEVNGKALAEGLQYGPSDGIPDLLNWLYGLQERSHGRKKGEGWRISVGSGSQDVIYKTFLDLFNTGETLLVEAPVYAGVSSIFSALRLELIEVETDAKGIVSQSLRSILENWPAGKPKPKALYTVPYGCNPTGMTAALERRKEVLELAHVHDFLILEDDPYYYLYFGQAPRVPSYFALELEEQNVGRVIRFDSMSKILSAGIRIGFVSGPEPILRSIDMHTGFSHLQPPSLTQTITFSILNAWGHDGFYTHTQAVSQFYHDKRDVFETAMKKHLDGLAEWTRPEAGMFFWFKLLIGNGTDEGDSESIIRTKAVERGVLALPGTIFFPGGKKSAYVRASFSLNTPEEVDEALRRLKLVILDARGEQA